MSVLLTPAASTRTSASAGPGSGIGTSRSSRRSYPPVPVVLQEENVKTLPPEIFARVDKLAAPRLVEYWEQDPCYRPPQDIDDLLSGAMGGGGGGGVGGSGGAGADGGPGGGGGGAFELIAAGRLFLADGVQFAAAGGDGAYGTPGAGGPGGDPIGGGAGGVELALSTQHHLKRLLREQGFELELASVAMYPSLTEWRGERVLWYPDRKHFLLGKRLPDSLLDDMDVPR